MKSQIDDFTIEEFVWSISGSIAEIRARCLSQLHCLCELIDNAIDANADTVIIEMDKLNGVTIHDNGMGMSNALARQTLNFGMSSKSGKSLIGRWGVGLKHAAIKTGGFVEAISKEPEGGKATRVILDIDEVLASNRYEGAWAYCDVDFPHGTIINIRRPTFKLVSISPKDLQKQYIVALKKGFCLKFNGCTIETPQWPQLHDQINTLIEWKGLKCKLKAGILSRKDACGFGGYWISYGMRTLHSCYTKAGFGGHSPSTFFAHVDLLDGRNSWELSTNKETARDLDQFLDLAVFPRVRQLIESASKSDCSFETDSALSDIKETLNQILSIKGKEKERRDVAEDPKKGTIEPVDSGKRKPYNKTQQADQGDALKKVGKFDVDFLHHENNEVIGSVHSFPGTIKVNLNSSNPSVPTSITLENRQSVLHMCLALVCDHLKTSEPKLVKRMGFLDLETREDREQFALIYGRLLTRATAKETTES